MSREQEQVAAFTSYIGATMNSQKAKFKEEAQEAVLEEHTEGKAYAMELTDVIIVSLGLIHCMGLNFEELFDEKMKINWQKYSEVPRLKNEGATHEEAVQQVRDQWRGLTNP